VSNRIPLADSGALGMPLRRTRAYRLGLAAALVLAAIVTFVLATRLDETPGVAPARGSAGVIVLDVSSSVADRGRNHIAHALGEAIDSGRRHGLVLFSDVAYEALPPGTPAEELRPFQRYFQPLTEPPPPGSEIVAPGTINFLRTPWSNAFSGGTSISSALRLARRMLARDDVAHPEVTLISDLADDDSDVSALVQTIDGYLRDRIAIKLVPIGATADNRRFFARLLRQRRPLEAPVEPAPPPLPEAHTQTPLALAAAALLLLGVLAANELWCGRLAWRGEARS
jgi:hypothetical protein